MKIVDRAPYILEYMSEDGGDFLSKCFIKDPMAQMTASDSELDFTVMRPSQYLRSKFIKMKAFEWVRGDEISRESSLSVCKATVVDAPRDADLPKLMAVKTCRDSDSDSLREEKRILDEVGASPHIVRSYGAGLTVENGQRFYNIFHEFAPGGTLEDELKRHRGWAPSEWDVKRHTRAILAGLSAIHAKGVVHCDIKPRNILLCDGGVVKIAGFRRAKKGQCGLRGTSIYIAPEAVKTKECAPPCDVWALGCVVLEMVSGQEPWDEVAGEDVCTILKHIGNDDSFPCIPEDISEDGRDFLSKCLMKDPTARWTAQMLLSHPFVAIPACAITMEDFEWVRGEEISCGSSGSVSKATVVNARDTNLPKLMAVKTCRDSLSNSLREEKRILDKVGESPHIVRCYGDGLTIENGQSFYNIFLEFAPGGTLEDELKRRQPGWRLAERDLKRHTRAILAGLSAIHAKGLVHGDIKPQNILLCNGGVVKIKDFGLAKKGKCGLRGTPIYIAPETVKTKECAPPCDIWALGCLVSETVSGKKPWDDVVSEDVNTLLKHIGKDDSVPCIPEDMSEDGRDFLSKCFIKDPKARWTAQMLLNHPFIAIPVPDCKPGRINLFGLRRVWLDYIADESSWPTVCKAF